MWVVSEADIIRSQIDCNHTGRSHIANPVIYDSSIGILPVSRLLKPKRDLKELMEQRQLAKHYLKKAKEASDIKDKIKYEVFAEGLLHPIRYVLESTTEEDRIDSFEDTWLSNFHPVTVEHDGKSYPTVEHAYQAAKFTSSDITQLSAEQRVQVDALLQERGHDPAIIDLATIFTNTDVSPGTIKLLAGILQKFHFVPPEWDSQRVDVMIALLVQKYQDPELAKRLIATGAKVLIEGNTWNDTFWGVSNNRGRNILGGILMNIRDKIKNGTLKTNR